MEHQKMEHQKMEHQKREHQKREHQKMKNSKHEDHSRSGFVGGGETNAATPARHALMVGDDDCFPHQLRTGVPKRDQDSARHVPRFVGGEGRATVPRTGAVHFFVVHLSFACPWFMSFQTSFQTTFQMSFQIEWKQHCYYTLFAYCDSIFSIFFLKQYPDSTLTVP